MEASVKGETSRMAAPLPVRIDWFWAGLRRHTINKLFCKPFQSERGRSKELRLRLSAKMLSKLTLCGFEGLVCFKPSRREKVHRPINLHTYCPDLSFDPRFSNRTVIGRQFLTFPVLRSLAALTGSCDVMDPRARFPAMKHARWSIRCCGCRAEPFHSLR